MSISGKRVRLESEPLLSLKFNTMKKKLRIIQLATKQTNKN